MSAYEELAKRFNTVGSFWHDAYAEWQVVADSQRCVFDDCRWEGWGATLDAAVANLKQKSAPVVSGSGHSYQFTTGAVQFPSYFPFRMSHAELAELNEDLRAALRSPNPEARWREIVEARSGTVCPPVVANQGESP